MRLVHHLYELAKTPYYRTRPIDSLQYTYAKLRLARSRVRQPAEFLELLGVNPRHALSGFSNWRGTLIKVLDSVSSEPGVQGGISLEDGMVLYGIARASKPSHSIETGVAAGVSTAFLGAALIENGTGYIHSIELPSSDGDAAELPDGCTYDWPIKGVGWAVPKEIREGLGDRHALILEDVRTALPALLHKLGRIDLFFHDDLHTPDHMFWEYNLVWPHLSSGGFLLSDDADFGWIKFCRKMGLGSAALVNIQRLTGVRKIQPQ